jgi:hypothetical protein
MKMARVLLVSLMTLGTPAVAQTAAELLTVAAISATLDANIRLPSGAFMVTNPKYAQEFAAQLGADAGKYTNYSLYVAKGLATRLADNFIGQLETSFATSGYFKGTTSSQTVGAEVRTRSEYTNDMNGKTLLLYVVKRADGVYFLVGQKK